MKNLVNHFLKLILFILLFSISTNADTHVIIQQVRKFMNFSSPTILKEMWIGEQAVFVKEKSIVTIYRYDSLKVWTISLATNKYFEEELKNPDEEETKKPSISLNKKGFTYEPQYDWVITKNDNKKDVIQGYDCESFIGKGEADYSHEEIEFWYSPNSSVRIKNHYDRFLKAWLEEEWKVFKQIFDELQSIPIIKYIKTTENPITSPAVIEKVINTLDSTIPPSNTYELPHGCMKVNSMDDL